MALEFILEKLDKVVAKRRTPEEYRRKVKAILDKA